MWPRETFMLTGLLCVFLAAAVSAGTEVKVYGKLGGEVVLKPDVAPLTDPITSIFWKDGPDLAAQWEGTDGTDVDLYRHFKARGNLNTSSGELTIRGLSRNDSGVYTPEINNKDKPAIRLIVISAVPKPSVRESCEDAETSCTLTCDGDVTDAGPVSYSWRSDDVVLSSTREQRITKEDTRTKEFTCELQNPVSQESSQPFLNPFTPPAGKLNVSTGLTVFLCSLFALLLLVAVHRCKAGEWFFQKDNMPWEADFWRKDGGQSRDAVDSNGSTTPDNRIDEETPMK